jgi:hypothetical protein
MGGVAWDRVFPVGWAESCCEVKLGLDWVGVMYCLETRRGWLVLVGGWFARSDLCSDRVGEASQHYWCVGLFSVLHLYL